MIDPFKEKIDLATLYDHRHEKSFVRSPPFASCSSKRDAEAQFLHCSSAANAIYDITVKGGVPSDLRPATPEEAKEIIATWRDVPQYRDVLRIAEAAATWRSYLSWLDYQERQEARAADEQQLATWRAEASPDPAKIARLCETIAEAKAAEKFLEQVTAQVVPALDAHDSAEAARQELERIYDTERRAREGLKARGLDAPTVVQRLPVPQSSDDAFRAASALKFLKGRAFGREAMARKVFRGRR